MARRALTPKRPLRPSSTRLCALDSSSSSAVTLRLCVMAPEEVSTLYAFVFFRLSKSKPRRRPGAVLD